jgi:small-conductance mechanosensitive channel
MDHLTLWLGGHGVRLEPLIGTVLILAVAAVVISLVNRSLGRWLLDPEARHPIPYETLLSVVRGVHAFLWIVVAFVILSVWGVGLSGLWTFLVGIATAVGVGFLAVWTMVSNITASLFIAIWRPFHIGQTVELFPEGVKGRVVDRNLMYTALRGEDASVLQIPNNLFFQKMFRVSPLPAGAYPAAYERVEASPDGRAAGGSKGESAPARR